MKKNRPDLSLGGREEEPTRHEQLFASYVKELRESKTAAEEAWKELVELEMRKVSNRQQAVWNLKRRWPCGPASHPYIIAILRKYFFACIALNDELASIKRGDEEVYPHLFVSEWLLQEETDDLADFVSVLKYWPIGVNDEGDFV